MTIVRLRSGQLLVSYTQLLVGLSCKRGGSEKKRDTNSWGRPFHNTRGPKETSRSFSLQIQESKIQPACTTRGQVSVLTHPFIPSSVRVFLGLLRGAGQGVAIPMVHWESLRARARAR